MCIHHTDITVHPQPWIANLGSKAKFSCTVLIVLEGDEVTWRINGRSSALMGVLEPVVVDQQNGTTLTSTLTVTANVEGTTTIQCRATSDFSLPVLSQEVTLTVQGMVLYNVHVTTAGVALLLSQFHIIQHLMCSYTYTHVHLYMLICDVNPGVYTRTLVNLNTLTNKTDRKAYKCWTVPLAVIDVFHVMSCNDQAGYFPDKLLFTHG